MKKYTAILLSIVLAIFIPAAALSLYFESASGDLTRIGNYPERDYGWTARQPVVEIDGNPSTAPDIVVLGDSFSERNIWQSALENKIGKKIATYLYNDIGCIDNFVNYASTLPSVKLIVIETVERVLVPRFSSTAGCPHYDLQPNRSPPGTTEAQRKSTLADIRIWQTYKVLLNTVKVIASAGKPVPGSVVNVPLKKACANLSNTRSDRLLYFPEDDEKRGWGAARIDGAIANISRLQKNILSSGKKFVFVSIPDKSSVYGECIITDANRVNYVSTTTKTLGDNGIYSPDLNRLFAERKKSVVDLYFPNDTHLSTAGYIELAVALADYLDRIGAF